MEVDKDINPDILFELFNLQKIFALIVGLLVIALASKTLYRLANKVHDKFPSYRLLSLQVATILSFTIYILGTTTLVYVVVHPPKSLLLALGGSAAVAIGFALKDVVASLIAGLILLFDRPFQVGDRITFEDIYGEIVTIGLRAVRLVTLDDNLVTIPNSKFISEAVASGNAGSLDMMVCVDFVVRIDSNLRKARDLLHEVVVTSKYVYLKKPVTVVLTEKTQGHLIWVEIKVKSYVLDVRYEKDYQSDIVLRGNEVLKENGIHRPQFVTASL